MRETVETRDEGLMSPLRFRHGSPPVGTWKGMDPCSKIAALGSPRRRLRQRETRRDLPVSRFHLFVLARNPIRPRPPLGIVR